MDAMNKESFADTWQNMCVTQREAKTGGTGEDPGFSFTDGMTYAPKGIGRPVVAPGEFVFAVTGLEHGHIYGMCNGLVEAGAGLKWVYDPDPEKVTAFLDKFPEAKVALSLEQILLDPEVALVAAAAVPCQRCDLGLQVMSAGKDYFTDKAPFTSLDQLARARQAVALTGQKYMVYYSERLHNEAAVYAGDLLARGAIGRVIQVLGMGPHRLRAQTRPAWFYDKKQYGGILCDIGSHQFEQFLAFSGAEDARVLQSRVANYGHPEYPDLDDFGEANLLADNGAGHYMRVDWFTPDGLRTWGDGRTFILGTQGYIELRKYINIGSGPVSGNHVFLVNQAGEFYEDVSGKVGFPFFGQLILDCLQRTELAMTQAHAFKAAELSLLAQAQAEENLSRSH